MLSVFKKVGLVQVWTLSLLVSALGFVCFAVGYYGQPERHRVEPSYDLAGIWEFHNGPLTKDEANRKAFPDRVEVPKLLPDILRKNLKNEFWYRLRFQLPSSLDGEEIAFSLGSVKGRNEIYWNGQYVGAGGISGYAVFKVPKDFIINGQNTLLIKVERSDTLYQGIVHFYPMSVGKARAFEDLSAHYYFDIGVRPLLQGSFKLFVFALFCLLLCAMPQRKEYSSFAIYALLSALAAICSSRFMPFYDDFPTRNALMALMRTASFSFIPLLAVQFIRESRERRIYAFAFGQSVASVFVLAAFISGGEARIAVYRMAGEWLAIVLMLPSAILVGWQASRLPTVFKLRRAQLWMMGASLLAGSLAWSTSANSYLRFEAFFSWELLDLTIFIGMAAAMTLDFTVQHHRSVGVEKIVPKWFSGFVSSGATEARVELPLVCLAVDTVGYTKLLASLGSEEKLALHQEIREAMQGLSIRFGAQKLTDRGDGALFGWDLPSDVADGNLQRKIIGACAFLRTFADGRFALQFRAGFAAGLVTGEMRNGQFSFLGQALNAACRLETIAEPGVPLLDASLVHIFDGHCRAEWVEVDIKGVVYRGRPLKQAS
jgi:hypothetical protein